MGRKLLLLTLLGLSACTQHGSRPEKSQSTQTSRLLTTSPVFTKQPFGSHRWLGFTQQAANHYGVDPKLVSAIISVESGGNPRVVSRSNAIGLMQIKASTAGRAVYQAKGKSGQPTKHELSDPAKNIDIGTAYLRLLQESELAGIKDPLTLRYATIVAYANGSGALMRIFSASRQQAIAKINAMSPDQFYSYVQQQHPAAQAPRYLRKITEVYEDS